MVQAYNRLWRSAALLLALGLLICVLPASAADKASTAKKPTSTDITNAVAQSYGADPSVQIAMVVQLKPKDPKTVIPLANTQIGNMLGVVIPQNQANIVITPGKITQQQVLVATTGRYDVLVSNQQGNVGPGDYLTVSAIAGVVMKASENEAQVIGQAAGTFDSKSGVISTVKLKDTTGKSIEVKMGRVPLDINISHNPQFQVKGDHVPQVLNKVATGVASKPVSAARIYLSVVILFLISILTGNILYSGVRSGMIAVGRNPLSKKSIIRSLIETIIAGVIIFIIGVFAVYLLLKL